MQHTSSTISDLPVGQKAVVQASASEQNPAHNLILQKLASMGVSIGTQIQVIAKAPFGGPIALSLGSRNISIDRKLASSLFALSV